MISMQELKDHYRFSDDDAELLKSFQPLLERFRNEFYDHLVSRAQKDQTKP